MFDLIPIVATSTVVGGALLWWWMSRFAPRPQPAAVCLEQPSGVRVLHDAEEIASILRQTAADEYRLAERLQLRGDRHARLGNSGPTPNNRLNDGT